MNREFGELLASLRRARRLSLDQAARSSNSWPHPLSRSQISRFERGDGQISLISLQSLARLYGACPVWLAERAMASASTARYDEGRLAGSARDWISRARTRGDAGDWAGAGHAYHLARRLALTQNDRETRVRAERGEIRALLAEGKLLEARERLERTEVGRHRIASDTEARAWWLMLSAFLNWERGQIESACALTLQLERCERLPVDVELALPRLTGKRLEQECDWEAARRTWLDALEIARRRSARSEAIHAELHLAICERMSARTGDALARAERVRVAAASSRMANHETAARLELVRLHRALGHWREAEREWGAARDLARSVGDSRAQFSVLAERWRLARARGEVREAERFVSQLEQSSELLAALPLDCCDLLPAD